MDVMDRLVVVPRRDTLRRIASARQLRNFHGTKVDRHVGWIALLFCLSLVMATPMPPKESAQQVVDDYPDEVEAEQEQAPHDAAFSPEDRFGVLPKWVNPCGGILDEAADPDAQPLSDADIADNVILDIHLALNHANSFKDDFVQSVFRSEFQEVIRTWAHVRYAWLPADDVVPKSVGENVPGHRLQSLQLATTLKDIFLATQKIAVGMEQVIVDQAVYGSNFLEQFVQTENRLGTVLCSLQLAMLEKDVVPDEYAARQLMTDEYRDMRSASGRNLRDFVILRDYINLLEYTAQVLQHFRHQPNE